MSNESGQSENKAIEERKKRLSRLKQRHGRIGKPDFSESQHASGTIDDAEDAGAAIDGLFGDERNSDRDDAANFRIGNIVGYLTQKSEDGEKIPGTDVNPKSIEKLTKYLKGRQRTGSAPPWTKRALDFLESSKNEADGSYDPDKIKRLLGFLKSRAKKAKKPAAKQAPPPRIKRPSPEISTGPGGDLTPDETAAMIDKIRLKIVRIKEDIASIDAMIANLQTKESGPKSGALKVQRQQPEDGAPQAVGMATKDDEEQADNWFGGLIVK